MKLKILFVIDSLGPGGAERSLAEMLPGLTHEGLTPIVAIFYRRQESLEDTLRAGGADIRLIEATTIVRRAAALRRLIRQEAPDVIHTTLWEADVLGRIASIGQRKVVISSFVSAPYDPVRQQLLQLNVWKLWLAKSINIWTARLLTSHFHAVSEAVKHAAVESMGLRPERISVIQRGRDTRLAPPSAEDRARARQKLGLRDSDEVILNVGRQVPEKGQRYLLEAMETIAAARPRSLLLVAGTQGRETRELEAIWQRPALKERVRFLGHRTDIPEVLMSADVFAFPSLSEGAAGAVVEAMAAGLPIVASNIPAIGEVVEEGRNGFLVNRMTVAPLAEAIINLLENRDKAKAFGKRSRQIFEEKFTLERCTARMAGFYRALTAGYRSLDGSKTAPEFV